MSFIQVALDGPTGAGKSTIARECAARLGNFIYIDTGALYRAVALAFAEGGVDPDDASAVAETLAGLTLEIKLTEQTQRVICGGRDVSDRIREPEISMLASRVSAIPEVRAHLLSVQRELAAKNNVIMDGRDIGTVILPQAQVKIFLTADPEIRAKRRYDELAAKGAQVSYSEVLSDLQKRDHDDSHRAHAPLKRAEDAILADTGGLDFEQSVELILGIINQAIEKYAE